MKAIGVGRTDTAQDLKLDVSGLLDSRLLIQGNSGAGKSWLMRLIAEQVAGRVPTFILDPEGEYATLRERLDMVLVGQAGEVPADPRAAGLLARKLMELRVSAVIDLYDLKLGARREFVRTFLDSLLNLPKDLYKSPVLIGIDEAHLYCPEKSAGESVATESVIALMSQGRKRGLCGALLTQRLSKLHKDAAAEANNVIIGRTWLDVDQKRAGDVLGLSGNAERQALRDLAKGEFLAFGPAFSLPGVTRFQSAQVQTTHPQAGKRHTIEAPAPSAAITAVLPQLRDLPQKAAAEARGVDELRAEVAALKRQLAAKPTPAPAVPPKPIEVQVLLDWQVKRLAEDAEQLVQTAALLRDDAARLEKLGHEITAALRAAKQSLSARAAGAAPIRSSTMAVGEGRPAASSRPAPCSESKALPGADLPPARRRILDALAYLEGLGLETGDRVQVAFLADQSPSSSGYANNLGGLRSSGLIDYPSNGRLRLTDDGRAVADPGPVPSTSAELQDLVRQKLPAAKWRIVDALIRAYPGALTRDDLAALADQSPTSSGFANNLGSLRTLGVIEYPSQGLVGAADILFLEGR